MIINHNLNAMNAHRNMGAVTNQQGRAMEKLSSGLRINRAGDDAAGLAISEKMRAQIRGLNQASRNAQDGISMIQTAEGALSETQAISQRMRELAVQSANGTYTDEDRELINQEFGQLKKEIDRIASDTEFNGSKVLNGNLSGKDIKTAPGGKATDQIEGNITGDLEEIFGEVDTEELAKLGEGTFHIKLTKTHADVVTVDLIDKSHFNGEKEYTLDSITIDVKGDKRIFELGGIQFELNKLDDASNIIKDKESVTIKFTNEAEKTSDGVLLQVGANKDQMIGVSMENMRSRELGLGGIGVGTAKDAQEAIERLDVAIERVSAQRADLGAAQID